jgi:hypothetical protein
MFINHYREHNSLPLDTVLNYMNADYTLTHSLDLSNTLLWSLLINVKISQLVSFLNIL